MRCIAHLLGVLYRAFPNSSVNRRVRTTGYKLVKDRLTAVLTVFADGYKAPLVVIGPSDRPECFHRCNTNMYLGIHYYSQKNSWNSKDSGHCRCKS